MTETNASAKSIKIPNAGRTNTTKGSIKKVVIEEKPEHFDNEKTYHFSVKLYYYDTTTPDKVNHRRGTWTEILPFPQEVSGTVLNKFVAMVYGEANADSFEGMKACVDATIRRIGDDSWGKIKEETTQKKPIWKIPMNLEDTLKERWFEAIGREKYNKSLSLNLKGQQTKAHNLAYKAVCTVVKEKNGAAKITYPYNQWLSATSDSKPGGVVIGGNKFRIVSQHPGRPE